MSTTEKAAGAITNSITSRSLVPFSGGLLVVYAFFWPESYGHWLGVIVHSFRAASGI